MHFQCQFPLLLRLEYCGLLKLLLCFRTSVRLQFASLQSTFVFSHGCVPSIRFSSIHFYCRLWVWRSSHRSLILLCVLAYWYVSLYNRWDVFRGELPNPEEALFHVKRSTYFQVKTSLHVFLASHKKGSKPQFKVKGNYLERNCTIFHESQIVAEVMILSHHLWFIVASLKSVLWRLPILTFIAHYKLWTVLVNIALWSILSTPIFIAHNELGMIIMNIAL